MEIKELIENVKNIAKANFDLYTEGGLIAKSPWKIFDKACIERIEYFESLSFVIPEDLKKFLLFSNGLECVSCEQRIHSIESIIEVAEISKDTIRKGVYEIAYFMGDSIYIDSSLISTGNYLFYEGSGFDCGVLLECDFTTFLERLVLSNFSNYWRWVPEKKKAFHI